MNARDILDPSLAIVRRVKDCVTALNSPKYFESIANDGKDDFVDIRVTRIEHPASKLVVL